MEGRGRTKQEPESRATQGAVAENSLSRWGCCRSGTAGSAAGAFHDVHGRTNTASAGCAGAATYRVAVGPQQGRKVFTLQTLPACDPEDDFTESVCKVAGFSLHAGVAVKAHQRKQLERLCRYIALQGCRVLRRLGTIASAQGRRYRRNACRSPPMATSVMT